MCVITVSCCLSHPYQLQNRVVFLIGTFQTDEDHVRKSARFVPGNTNLPIRLTSLYRPSQRTLHIEPYLRLVSSSPFERWWYQGNITIVLPFFRRTRSTGSHGCKRLRALHIMARFWPWFISFDRWYYQGNNIIDPPFYYIFLREVLYRSTFGKSILSSNQVCHYWFTSFKR